VLRTSAAAPFDVSILEIGEGVFEIKATNGDTHPGRRRLRPARDGLESPRSSRRTTASTSARIGWRWQRLKEAAERAKIELSTTVQTEIQPAVHHATPRRPKAPRWPDADARAKLESLVADLVDRTLWPVPPGDAGRGRPPPRTSTR